MCPKVSSICPLHHPLVCSQGLRFSSPLSKPSKGSPWEKGSCMNCSHPARKEQALKEPFCHPTRDAPVYWDLKYQGRDQLQHRPLWEEQRKRESLCMARSSLGLTFGTGPETSPYSCKAKSSQKITFCPEQWFSPKFCSHEITSLEILIQQLGAGPRELATL